MPNYIRATSRESEPRWRALLDAALEQPHPSPALIAALRGLEARAPGPLARSPRVAAVDAGGTRHPPFHFSECGPGSDIRPIIVPARRARAG